MLQRKISLPTLTRVAAITPKSLNEEARTVDVVWTTGSRVFRRGFFDSFHEELGLEKKNVRMKRLKSGTAPVLDNHGFSHRSGVDSVLGVVQSAELIPGKEGIATLRFSKRENVNDVFNDIKDGIIRNISVGFNVFSFEKVGEIDKIPILRAVDWEPVEISTVAAGADPDARIRSDEQPTTECIIIDETRKKNENENEKVDKTQNLGDNQKIQDNTRGEISMELTPEQIAKQEKEKLEAENLRKVELEKATKVGAQAEKVRCTEIRSMIDKVGLDSKLIDQYIEENKSLDEVRTLVIDEIAKKDNEPEKQTRSANEIKVGEDLSRKGRIEGMTSAILHRYRPFDEEDTHQGKRIINKGFELVESGRDYAYLSFVDLARTCLEASGVRTGSMPVHRLVDLALSSRAGLHSTSDFPEILANVVNKTLRAGYLAAPITWKAFTREVFVNDFKEISRTNLGDAPKLEKLQEGSEAKRGTISEVAEKYFVEEYAKILAITRKIIVNDDLDFVARLPERMGRRARDLESDLLWDIIKANANLSDGNALFSAAHGNLSTSPAAPAEVGLSEGRKLMRRQLGLDSAEIAITPVWMYVPPEHETAAEKLIASIVPDSSTNVSPFSSAGRTPLRLDVEPRLETGPDGSVNPWYLMADKGQIDMLELARLSGSRGPQTQTREGFDVNGTEIKIMHDVGAKAIEHRGLFKNAGA